MLIACLSRLLARIFYGMLESALAHVLYCFWESRLTCSCFYVLIGWCPCHLLPCKLLCWQDTSVHVIVVSITRLLAVAALPLIMIAIHLVFTKNLPWIHVEGYNLGLLGVVCLRWSRLQIAESRCRIHITTLARKREDSTHVWLLDMLIHTRTQCYTFLGFIW